MAELLLMIYMIPVLIVFSLLLRLVMWIIGKVIRLTWWLVKNAFVLVWKVLLFIVMMVIANLRATGPRNYLIPLQGNKKPYLLRRWIGYRLNE